MEGIRLRASRRSVTPARTSSRPQVSRETIVAHTPLLGVRTRGRLSRATPCLRATHDSGFEISRGPPNPAEQRCPRTGSRVDPDAASAGRCSRRVFHVKHRHRVASDARNTTPPFLNTAGDRPPTLSGCWRLHKLPCEEPTPRKAANCICRTPREPSPCRGRDGSSDPIHTANAFRTHIASAIGIETPSLLSDARIPRSRTGVPHLGPAPKSLPAIRRDLGVCQPTPGPPLPEARPATWRHAALLSRDLHGDGQHDVWQTPPARLNGLPNPGTRDAPTVTFDHSPSPCSRPAPAAPDRSSDG